MKSLRTLSVLLVLPFAFALSATRAFAQPATVADSVEPKHTSSITLSPVHLAIGVVELTGEFRVAPKLGVAATLGGGKLSGVSVYELGAQLCYYFTGDFDGGFHVGAEAQFLGAGATRKDASGMEVTAKGAGLATGAMLGWKWIGDSGFSFVAQAGVQYFAVRAKASSTLASAESEDSDLAPLVNLNAGWSF